MFFFLSKTSFLNRVLKLFIIIATDHYNTRSLKTPKERGAFDTYLDAPPPLPSASRLIFGTELAWPPKSLVKISVHANHALSLLLATIKTVQFADWKIFCLYCVTLQTTSTIRGTTRREKRYSV